MAREAVNQSRLAGPAGLLCSTWLSLSQSGKLFVVDGEIGTGRWWYS